MKPRAEPKRILLHVGYHKTASTLLQRHIFPRLPDCDLVGPGRPRSTERALTDHLLYARGDDDDRAVGAMLAEFSRKMAPDGYDPDRVRAAIEARVGGASTLIVSREDFSGNPMLGGGNRVRNARRLQELFPSAHILVIIRDQRTMLRSLYSQYIQKGGTRPFADYVSGTAPGTAFDPDHLCYDRLVADYRERFGGRVTVVAYEEMARDPGGFVDLVVGLLPAPISSDLRNELVATMVGERANRSLSRVSRALTRATNRALYASRFNPQPFVAHTARTTRLRRAIRNVDSHLPVLSTDLGPRQRRYLDETVRRYRVGNAELAASTGLPLRELGYPMPC